MTNEKAGALIGRLKYHYDGEMREALEVVEKANRLQIPREPYDVRQFANTKIGLCSCGDGVNSDMKCCATCGQKIDWSEE